MQQKSAPKLMLLQFNHSKRNQGINEVKEEMEGLMMMLKNICDHLEIFEEKIEEVQVSTVKDMIRDADFFYKETVLKELAIPS